MWMMIGYGIQFASIVLLIGVNSNLTEISRKLDKLVRAAARDSKPPAEPAPE